MSDRYCGESNGNAPGSQMNCGERWNKLAEQYKCDKCKAYDQGYEDGRQSNITKYAVVMAKDIDPNIPTYEMPK